MYETSAPVADRTGPRALRADLFSPRRRPMPPLTWPRHLPLLPHVLVCLGAVSLSATGADPAARTLAIAHAATLVAALWWPAPAWWLSTVLVVGIAVGHPPTHDNQIWAWIVHAGVLFLLALRVRLSSAAVAAALSALPPVLLKVAGRPIGSWSVVAGALVLYVAAVFVGAVARGRREDRERLTAQIAATARERARRTVLEERARIARELHDVVAHHMSVISVKADAAPYRVQDPPRELVTELAAIRANALEGLTELRRLLGLLRSETDGHGAAVTSDVTVPRPSLARLDALLGNVRATGLRVSYRVEGTARTLSPGAELSAYRIVQEALSNALRHAPGATVRVELAYSTDWLSIRVANGPGTRPADPSPGTGHGLTGMRERAAMLGGRLAAGPTPDGGYEVAVTLPAPDRSPAADEETPA
ncbi:sensor histidine kinase [Streptomyces albireticuli]|nr:sensor histidine kinase [Streptomyces albireticuli]MCD9144983.1 sensor histidine kinase [Streptomyces albireticuli]MCD9164409.1 sensor histidine kinase [Streptomyces albireticuli]MCD9194120.1 sensor histidine kinase [Streptomyces albireticuli]